MGIRKFLKWLGIFLGSIVGLALIAAIVINLIIASEKNRTFEQPEHSIDVPSSEEAIAEGARLAKLRGCNGGCHGDGSRGGVFFELPGGGQIVAPNVVRAAQDFTPAEFERVVRHGIRPDGTSVLLPMPSSMLYNLSDEDLGKILAFLRSLDPGSESLPVTRLGFIGRLMLFYFRLEEGSILSAEKIDHDRPRPDPLSEDNVERGRYLATTVCSECHGDDLRGSPEWGMPDLVMVMAYSREQFGMLMREGKALGDRELGLMSEVAVSRFANFRDEEIDDLHAYLQTLGSTSAAETADQARD